MTDLRLDAIGLSYPPQRHEVLSGEVGTRGVASLVGVLRWVGSARELIDSRMARHPVKLWESLVGGGVELSAGDGTISVGEIVTTVGRISEASRHGTLDWISLDVATQNSHGDLVVEGRITLVVPHEGSSAPLPKRRQESVPPTARTPNRRTTGLARYDFVRVVVVPERLPAQVDAVGVAADVLIRELCGGDASRLRYFRCLVGLPTRPGLEVVVHGRRDKKQPGTILFEVIDRAGAVLLADGIARITQ